MSIDVLNRRRLVIHHTHLLCDQIVAHMHSNDVLFFDDCLFSQYVFIKDNFQKLQQSNVDCVLGFSSGLYASENAVQIYSIESHILHDACNSCIQTLEDADRFRQSLYEMRGFMKLSQIKELLEMPNVHLAFHGCCHLKLKDVNGIVQKMMVFKRDIDDGIRRLEDFNMATHMFVYPYLDAFPASDAYLAKNGFTAVIGNGTFRVSIEDLASGKLNCDS